MRITSLQHPRVLHWVQLRDNKAYREENQAVLIAGKKMIKELRPDIIITLEPVLGFKGEQFLVTEAILKKITGLNNPDGFAAEMRMPSPQDLSSKQFLVILDQISDPGNLGTLLRTALAFKWEGVIVTPGTVDLFNDKAMRAAKGATFHLPYARLTHEEISEFVRDRKIHAFTADVKGETLSKVSFSKPMALILSNEAHGPGSWSEKVAKKITIPMEKTVESLNVATSGAILLYAMRCS